MIKRTETKKSADSGREVTYYTIDNQRGLAVTAMDFGATITSLVHGAQEKATELIVGFDSIEEYEQVGSYVGSTIGRVCNRIKNGAITIDGVEYSLTKNFGAHMLHGGARGFSYREWNGDIITTDTTATIRFTLQSLHLDEGFPGNVEVTADYTITADNALILEFRAASDQTTALNLTNHAYWNLAGEGSLFHHQFFINADSYLKTDHVGVFDGEMLPVAETHYDFRRLRPAVSTPDGARDDEHYDICYHLNNNIVADLPLLHTEDNLHTAAFVMLSDRSRAMRISTTYPSLQFFLPKAFNFPPTPQRFVAHGAFCMECMLHNDAHRFPQMPTTLLSPQSRYYHKTVHRFYSAEDFA